jgi:tetratricopeptide (TPR) repeat protein
VRSFFLTVLVLASGCARAPGGKPIEFIEDDYPRALAEARARAVPLFVDAWAPWCHTCLSLRAYVFPDVSLRRFSSRFVWLALDTERPNNAAIVDKLGIHVLPTLFVIDSTTEATALAWPGSLTATELGKVLDEALRTASGGDADAALRRGHRASAEGRTDEALAAYRAALAAAPAGWPGRPEAVDALVTKLGDAKRSRECADTAADVAPSMPGGTARADVVRVGIQCATDGDAQARGDSDGGRTDNRNLEALTSLGERMAGDPVDPILADDRSDLFDFVIGGWTSLGRPDDAHRVAQNWAAFLEREAGRAPSPAARAVFDAHRVAAYLALGEPERALPMLEETARDFPNDYNPPARMGRALLALGRPDDAIASLDRAIGLAYGPRKLTLWSLEADAYIARGDRAGARRTLEKALAFADAIALTGGYPRLRAEIAKRLAELSG